VAEAALVARAALERTIRSGDYGFLAGEPGVILSERPMAGLVSVMARTGKSAALFAAAKAAFAIDLPLLPRRVVSGDVTFLWSGPGRWLALAYRQSSEELLTRLSTAFAGCAALTEQGDGRVVIRIAGPRARDTLAKVLTIDLHSRAFRAGDTAITGAAHLELQIWQIDDQPSYEIALFRGFAGSFWHWLAQSAAEFGYRVVG
jgi:methylglutamate dehydrogenase subunit D